MQQSGVSWPIIPDEAGEAGSVTSVDISVMIAFAAGFVKTNDFQHPVRGMLAHLTILQWPEIQNIRSAARVACDDVQRLQQAASRFVVEQSRLAQMAHNVRVRNQGRETSERLRRQAVRVQRAQEQMQEMAAIVEARMRDVEP